MGSSQAHCSNDEHLSIAILLLSALAVEELKDSCCFFKTRRFDIGAFLSHDRHRTEGERMAHGLYWRNPMLVPPSRGSAHDIYRARCDSYHRTCFLLVGRPKHQPSRIS